MQKTTTFLMFVGDQCGKAEEAMEFYTSLFADSEIVSLTRAPDGTVFHATFTIAGQEYMANDSAAPHQFNFTPSISIWVRCQSEDEINDTFTKLSDGGTVMMPLDNYGFSKRFGWTADKYGVSWQLTLD